MARINSECSNEHYLVDKFFQNTTIRIVYHPSRLISKIQTKIF